MNISWRGIIFMQAPWTHQLFGIINARARQPVEPGCTVRFSTESGTFGVDLSTGEVSSGEDAKSEVVASDEVLTRIINRELSLQIAYKEQAITLSGEPEPFLRLAMVLDSNRAAA